jgi:hypothetical protein
MWPPTARHEALTRRPLPLPFSAESRMVSSRCELVLRFPSHVDASLVISASWMIFLSC